MILSEERQIYYSQMITDVVWKDDLVDFSDDDQAVMLTRKAIQQFVQNDLEIDRKARAKVASLKRQVLEGTPEWDVLYRKYYEEERGKSGQK
jgi:uncharacterized protein